MPTQPKSPRPPRPLTGRMWYKRLKHVGLVAYADPNHFPETTRAMNDPTLPLTGLSHVRGKSVVAAWRRRAVVQQWVLALAELEKRLRVADRLARCIDAPRCPDQVIHSVAE